jgi:diguanylate cyclase (GGDEF)-like protein
VAAPGTFPRTQMTKLHLLLVEDSVADAELVERHLKRTGLDFRIRRVESEPEMLRAFAEIDPSLIISDFSLPQFDGLRALELAVAHSPNTPFIFVSGTIGEERAIDALRKGATDYVLKTNLSRLSVAVERALREASVQASERDSERHRRDQEDRLQRLTRSYRMLSSTSSAILRLHNRVELLDEVCRIASQQGGYERVVISLVDANENCLRLRASAGADSQALRARELVPLDGPAMSLAKSALKTGLAQVVNDAATESPTADREIWLANGWQACAALPLLVDGTAIGAMTLYSSRAQVFEEAELGVLLELTANVCFALQYLDKDEALQFLAYFDGLTGLAKRQLYCQRLAALFAEEEEGLRSHAVLVFDVQKLSTINDSLGRYVGDRLIEEIAVRLKQNHANTDYAAYLGGGTFALALADLQKDPATDVIRTAQLAIARLLANPFSIGGQELRPAFRGGIGVYPEDANTADALLQCAEAALKASREDNEKCMLYSSVTQRPTSRSLAMEARLNAALDKDEFLLHYQPKVDIEGGRVVGVEALVRWRDKQAGLVSPGAFIPLLEQSGAIVEVGEWVIRQAVHDARLWIEQGLPPLRVAVNVSPLQLRRRDFVPGMLSALEPLGGRRCIDIEITESTLMQDIELSIQKLEQLRQAGVGVAIDDFGTGYSSLRLLSRLPVDILKIDRSFVQGMMEMPNLMTLVETIVSLAHAFDMHTVAEGVETAEQMSILRRIRCDQAQGFFQSRPVPALEIPSLIGRLSRGAEDTIDAGGVSAGNGR